MGRPRSTDPTEAFPLRIRGSLLARIREAAKAKGQTPAAWIADACEGRLDAAPAVRVPPWVAPDAPTTQRLAAPVAIAVRGVSGDGVSFGPLRCKTCGWILIAGSCKNKCQQPTKKAA